MEILNGKELRKKRKEKKKKSSEIRKNTKGIIISNETQIKMAKSRQKKILQCSIDNQIIKELIS